jgi:hypothetical protein
MKTSIAFAILLLSFSASAQQSKQIETDRPGETQSPSIVPAKKFQVEAGIRKEENESDYSILHPTALLRYGLLKRLEVRAELTGETHKFTDINDALTGLNPVELGFKLMLKEGKGASPAISLLSQFAIPKLSSKDFETPNVLPEVRLAFLNEFNQKFGLQYNLGARWDEPGNPPGWLYTLSPNYELTDRIHVFVEVYGEVRKNEKPEHVVDASIAWLLTDNLQLDVNGGTGISENAPKYVISAGVSVRF